MDIRKKIVLLAVLILIAFGGVRYLARVAKKGEDKTINIGHNHRQSVPLEYSILKNPLPSTDESVKRGREVYLDYCYRCHSFSGKGDGPDAAGLRVSPRDLTDNERMAHHTDGDHFYWITYGVGKERIMPSLEEKLTENERWDLVNYVRTLPFQDE